MQMNGKSAIIAFLVIYQKYGKMFVDHFKRTYPTDTNYHVPANEPSRLFISIFQFLFNKILKTCRY